MIRSSVIVKQHVSVKRTKDYKQKDLKTQAVAKEKFLRS
jgi:hypothetical protein